VFTIASIIFHYSSDNSRKGRVKIYMVYITCLLMFCCCPSTVKMNGPYKGSLHMRFQTGHGTQRVHNGLIMPYIPAHNISISHESRVWTSIYPMDSRGASVHTGPRMRMNILCTFNTAITLSPPSIDPLPRPHVCSLGRQLSFARTLSHATPRQAKRPETHLFWRTHSRQHLRRVRKQ